MTPHHGFMAQRRFKMIKKREERVGKKTTERACVFLLATLETEDLSKLVLKNPVRYIHINFAKCFMHLKIIQVVKQTSCLFAYKFQFYV